MKKINYKYLLSFLLTSKIFADAGLAPIYNLAEDVRDVVVNSKDFEQARSDEFRKSKESTDQIMAVSKVDKEVEAYANSTSKDCNQSEKDEKEKLAKKIEDRDYIIYFSGIYSEDDEDRALSHFQIDSYRNFMVGQYNDGKLANPYYYTYTNLVKDVQKANPNYSNLKLDEKIELINQFAQKKFKIDIPKDLLIEESLKIEMVNNPKEWKSNINIVKDELNFDQKMRIAARMGGVFLSNYNDARAANNDGKKISVEEMLESARTSTPGGVCRDVAYSQGQILKEFGVDSKNIYVITYDSSGGGHAVLAVQDPNNKNRIVKLNYNEMSQESEVRGVGALKQDTQLPDVGMNYKIYDVEAKPVANIPTEIGSILRDVTSAKASLIETKPYTIAKVGAKTPYGNVAVFTGTTSTGDKVVGGAIDKKFVGEYTEIDLAVAFGKREVDTPVVQMSQNMVYARLAEQLYTPEYNVGNVVTKADFGGSIEIFSSKHSGSGGGYEFDSSSTSSNTELNAGLKSVYKYSPTTKITAEARAYGYINWDDVRSEDKLALNYDRTEASVKLEKDFDDVELMATTGIVARRIGKSYFVGSGIKVKDTDTVVYANYASPVGNVPAFLPEANKRFILGGAQSVGDFNLTLEYKKDLDSKEDIFYLNSEYKF